MDETFIELHYRPRYLQKRSRIHEYKYVNASKYSSYY